MLYASSTIGIVAVGVALLMIGGEFDLSTGVTVVTAALAAALISVELGLNMWVGILISLLIALGIGFINGYLVVKTGIPSFLITLATFFMLRGHQPRRDEAGDGNRGDQQRLSDRRLRRRPRRSSPRPSRSAS